MAFLNKVPVVLGMKSGVISPLFQNIRKKYYLSSFIIFKHTQCNRCSARYIHVMPKLLVPAPPSQLAPKETSITGKVKRSFKFWFSNKNRMLRSSFLLYARCTDDIDAVDFFKEFQLPDTFFSWFLVTELHIWLCQVRVSKEGDEGRYVRNRIMEALWKDVDIRIKKLGEISGGVKKKGVNQLLEHFQSALFSYDEGLLSDDKVLAGALWRNFYSYQCESAINLEKLVHYVRLQVTHLESIPAAEIILQGKLSWAPLQTVKLPS